MKLFFHKPIKLRLLFIGLLLTACLSACDKHGGEIQIGYGFPPATPDGVPIRLADGTPNIAPLFDENYRLKYWYDLTILDPEGVIDEKKANDRYLATEFEQSYDNFIVTLDQTTVAHDFGRIEITVVNQNEKPFFLWTTAFLERYNNGSWIRIPRLLSDDSHWRIVGFRVSGEYGDELAEDSERNQYTASLNLDRIDEPFRSREYWQDEDPIFPELTPGEYRVAVYVGKEIVYAPFTIIAPPATASTIDRQKDAE